MIKRLHILLYTLLSGLIAPLGFAQEDQDEDDEQVYNLNPFEVDESADLGYTATNTLSGTRFNSSLRDTSASVSVWTQEFIDDTGLTEIDELIDYSLNTVLDTNDQDGAGGNFNVFTNATAVTQRIRTRGVEASRGIDYFKAITPDDSYKIGRYDDSRGPNGVLFGVSQAGGLINQSSLVANTYQDSGRVRYSFGSNSRDRAEFRFNKVIVEDKLAIVVAGLNQDNSHWRDFVSQDKERVYAAVTWRPTDRITFRANYEDGWELRTTIQQSPVVDGGLPWYDYLQAGTPLEDITFSPYRSNGAGAALNATTRALGLRQRDGNPRNSNRFTFIENDNTFINVVGNYLTDGYHRSEVVPVDGTPSLEQNARTIRINDPGFLPYHLNPGGPDFYRETDFSSHSAFLDIQLTDEWFFNVQFGHQRSINDVPQINGPRPELEFDPNTTKDAINADGPPNPYLGRMFFDGDYRRDHNNSYYEEIRVSTSYNLDFADKFDGFAENFGRHQIAVAFSEVDEESRRFNTWLGLGGNPEDRGTFTDSYGNRFQNTDYDNANYRVTIRNYVDLDDFSTWRAGSWRSLPATFTTDRYEGVDTTYPIVFLQDNPGNINYLVNQVTDSKMAVLQSHFWNDRMVFTYGYREDDVFIDRAGHFRDPIVGFLPDLDINPDTPPTEDIIPAAPETEFNGTVRTAGVVFHLTENLSLVANTASNIGVPDFRRTVYPDGATSPPPQGDGLDYGIDFSLFDNKINGRIVYYETDSIQEVVGGNDPAVRLERMYASLENAFEDAGNTAALDDLTSRRLEVRPEVNGRFRDNVSSGYELRLTANFTDNWRLTLNAAKTDRIVSNSFAKTAPFLGLIKNDDNTVIQGATEGPDIPDPEDPDSTISTYIIDSSAYSSDGAISKLLAYEAELDASLGQTFDTIFDDQNNPVSFSENLWQLADQYNGDIEVFEKRWGLRPYRFNVFTAYDFSEGMLKGWSIGGGYRYNSANIIGEENGVEFEGEPQTNMDLFLRYRTSRNSSFFGDGRWTFQVNIANALDNQDIIPSRLAIDGNIEYMVPGGRGIAYARFDPVAPRSYRFTVTYDF